MCALYFTSRNSNDSMLIQYHALQYPKFNCVYVTQYNVPGRFNDRIISMILRFSFSAVSPYYGSVAQFRVPKHVPAQ